MPGYGRMVMVMVVAVTMAMIVRVIMAGVILVPVIRMIVVMPVAVIVPACGAMVVTMRGMPLGCFMRTSVAVGASLARRERHVFVFVRFARRATRRCRCHS